MTTALRAVKGTHLMKKLECMCCKLSTFSYLTKVLSLNDDEKLKETIRLLDNRGSVHIHYRFKTRSFLSHFNWCFFSLMDFLSVDLHDSLSFVSFLVLLSTPFWFVCTVDESKIEKNFAAVSIQINCSSTREREFGPRFFIEFVALSNTVL